MDYPLERPGTLQGFPDEQFFFTRVFESTAQRGRNVVWTWDWDEILRPARRFLIGEEPRGIDIGEGMWQIMRNSLLQFAEWKGCPATLLFSRTVRAQPLPPFVAAALFTLLKKEHGIPNLVAKVEYQLGGEKIVELWSLRVGVGYETPSIQRVEKYSSEGYGAGKLVSYVARKPPAQATMGFG